MRAAVLRWLAVMAGVAGLSAAGLSAAGLAATQGAAASALRAAPLRHPCLVGAWRDDGGRTFTEWDGHRVAMHGGADNIDHIFGTGIDHDWWGRNVKPLYGTYRGHRLEEIIHGRNTLYIRGKEHSDRLRLTEQGWSAGSTNIYIYKGHARAGYLNQTGKYTMYFRCTARTLRWTYKKREDKETRISRKP